ncbi:peptidoglycan D,D-transpeptidase FtsI family protein [Lacticaseibacillus hulanensis]|uniref:peptidoglycan D,D-transpeptidase FtsI family protein n=1 Tax=Lacticaseibacillus hulanensis TaxID=2493111 RepID=UPI000FDC73D1|nr:penicillin-binding protein 2 [Lacticaseibacillus hulanensis]
MKYIRTPRPKRPKSAIPFRLNFLLFVAFLLFAGLVTQLAYLQIANGDSFAAEVNRTGTTDVSGNVPRGEIYDSQGRVMVDNKAEPAITYTKNVSTPAKQMYQVANRLTNYITVDAGKLQKRDILDYWLAKPANTKAVNKQLTKKQRGYKDDKLYKLQLKVARTKHVTLNAQEKQAAAIYKIMNGATQLSTVNIKDQNVSEKEIAVVSEHLTTLPGVNLGTNWEREYPNGKSMTTVIGHVSSEKAGLPSESLMSYLEAGYARNDRVGTSYLEKQYETALRGSKSQTEVSLSSTNQIAKQVEKYKGKKGSNLTLTIDSKFQAKVENIVKTQFNKALGAGNASLSDGAYAVVMNPNTGAVLSMVGFKHNFKTGKLDEDSLGVINRSFVMGSAVKPGMVLGALQDGVITRTNNTQSEDPIYLKGTKVKSSDYPVGTYSSMTAQHAIEVSSNIYMMRLVMKEAGVSGNDYIPKVRMRMNSNIFDKVRGYFNQFGLGLKTGIDMPGEVAGKPGDILNEYGVLNTGAALSMGFGNYDPYTLMEMGQYVSTIANGGYRMQPYLVQSIAQKNSDDSTQVESTTQPNILGKIGNSAADIDFVKQGMWLVGHGTDPWATAKVLGTLNPGVAAKTGTAQSFAHTDPENLKSPVVSTLNISLVAMAPAKNPQITVAVVMPNVSLSSHGYTKDMTHDIIQAYYDMYHVKKQSGYSSTAQTLQ